MHIQKKNKHIQKDIHILYDTMHGYSEEIMVGPVLFQLAQAGKKHFEVVTVGKGNVSCNAA